MSSGSWLLHWCSEQLESCRDRIARIKGQESWAWYTVHMLYSQVPSSFQAGRDVTVVVGSLTGDHLGCITQVLPLMHTV